MSQNLASASLAWGLAYTGGDGDSEFNGILRGWLWKKRQKFMSFTKTNTAGLTGKGARPACAQPCLGPSVKREEQTAGGQ